MAQQLRELAVCAKDYVGSILLTHTNSLLTSVCNYSSKDLTPLHRHACKQTLKINISKKKKELSYLGEKKPTFLPQNRWAWHICFPSEWKRIVDFPKRRKQFLSSQCILPAYQPAVLFSFRISSWMSFLLVKKAMLTELTKTSVL